PLLAACAPQDLPKKSFGAATEISSAVFADDYDLEPTATLSADGSIDVLFMKNRSFGAPTDLRRLRIDDKGVACAPQQLTTNRPPHLDRWPALDRPGERYAVSRASASQQPPPAHQQIQLVASKDGGAWGAPVVADDAAHDCPNDEPDCLDKPMIAI